MTAASKRGSISAVDAAAVAAAPPDRAATAISAMIDAPPESRFSAWRRRGTTNRPIDPGLRTFDPADAGRLEQLTADLLATAS